MTYLKLLLLIVISTSCSFTIIGQDATDIIKKADDLRRGNSSYAELTIEIVRPTWSREMKVKTWSLTNDFSMILITAPARDKGTVFLKRKNEIWNWIPSIERNIKLPPSMMMQSWMGSDFTNDDLIEESSIVEDYYHTLVGDTIILDKETYKIELIPKPDAPVVWGKIYSWISKGDFLELKAEMFDEDDYKVSFINFSDIKDLGGRILPSIMEYNPVDEPGNKTIISYDKVIYDIDVDNSFFSIKNMKRVK